MVDTIFINDEYVYKTYPLPQRLDKGTLYPIISLEQVTSIQDLLGSALYEHLYTKVTNQTLTTDEAKLFKLVQLSLSLYSVRSAVTFLRSATSKTKNEEQKSDQISLDSIISAVDSKISYVDKRVVNFIKSKPTILTIAQSSDNDKFVEEDTYNGSPIFYPDFTIEGECQE
jgi:translation initiation factor 2B subunit (eIF-2B alpha/beta/delta family)